MSEESTHCPETGKRIFESLRHARTGMRASRGEGAHRISARLRVYLCPHCRGWHYTSRDKGEM